jgi:hypothetical protein
MANKVEPISDERLTAIKVRFARSTDGGIGLLMAVPAEDIRDLLSEVARIRQAEAQQPTQPMPIIEALRARIAEDKHTYRMNRNFMENIARVERHITELEGEHAAEVREDWNESEWEIARNMIRVLRDEAAGRMTKTSVSELRAEVQRIAEAKRAILWAAAFIKCLPDGSSQVDDLQGLAERYVASQEQRELG